MNKAPVPAFQCFTNARLARLLAQRDAQVVGAGDERDIRIGRVRVHGDQAPWNVRLMTSICCSRVSRTKFTAYPETRMVSCGYFSGCSIASSSIVRLRTFTFM